MDWSVILEFMEGRRILVVIDVKALDGRFPSEY